MVKSNYIASLRQVATSILLPVAFLTQAVHLAQAQVDCNGAFFTITTQENATTLSSCSYFQGTVYISSKAEGDIIIDGLNAIGGQFRTMPSENNNLTSISSPSLNLIGSDFSVSYQETLRSIRFPKLEKVADGFRIAYVPELVETDFGALAEIGATFTVQGVPKLETFPVSGGGIRNLLSSAAAAVQITDSGFRSLNSFFHGSVMGKVLVSNLPNLHEMTLDVLKADEILIEGNGNLTIYMNGTIGWLPQGEINFLNVTGVRAIEPCGWPAVGEFIVTGNPIEHLRFERYNLKKFVVQNNPQLKSLWPTRRDTRAEFTEIIITNNPLLKLSAISTGPDPVSTLREKCAEKEDREGTRDVWTWPYVEIKKMNISADIDANFFDGLLDRWSEDRKGPKIGTVDIVSKNLEFNCTVFDEVRTKKGGITDYYSCQNQTAPYGSAASLSPQVWLAVALFAVTLGALHL